MVITLNDAEYAALSKEAAKRGKAIDYYLHEVLTQHIEPSDSISHSLTSREIGEYLYREGITEHLPTDEPDTPEVEAEREYLAHLFAQGKPISEMVIEDRGPR
jgi:hypothetical protein